MQKLFACLFMHFSLILIVRAICMLLTYRLPFYICAAAYTSQGMWSTVHLC